MFGDIMHGGLLLIFAIWLIFADRSNKDCLASIMAPVRYIFLLMGFFATYMGFIYNDFTSNATQIFGTGCYDRIENGEDDKVFMHKTDENCVYPFGIDPVWFRSQQEISFNNSFKMKISVIFGVSQMVLGTTMKCFNAV
jgi:V-type H+-transporting ATPase subunit a